ncbi:PAPP1 protein, partial [Polypterus senegalus]|nr:PAPP1 protein [Polypterus senegalus]
MTCVDGKWDKMVTCKPVDCGIPDKYHVYPATFHCPEGTTYGKVCEFHCKEPAKLRALWNFCIYILVHPHYYSLTLFQCSQCVTVCLIIFACIPAIVVRAFKIQCTEDGTWQTGDCVPVTCDPPPDMFHGMYQCTKEFYFDSVCRINCDKQGNRTGPNNEIRCRKDGNWTGSFHVCKNIKEKCLSPHDLNRNIKLECNEGYGIGTCIFFI